MMRICVIIMSKFIIILSKDMNRIKKYETGIVGSFLLSLLLLFSSCQNSGLMYDVSQPGTVYFVKKASADAPVCSFVFEVEDEITYEVPVKLMGMPCNYDREFVVTLKQDTMTTIKAGGVSYPVETAELGKDFDMGNLIIPADSIMGKIVFTLHRIPEMQNTYRSVLMEIGTNENFIPLYGDYYRFFISDGDVPLPTWWNNGGTGTGLIEGWQMYIGKFFPEKFRLMLEYYWDMEETQPEFYEEAVSKYGKYLDKEGITAGFYQKDNPAVWAKYVLIPLYEHYKANPIPNDCPFAESGNQGEFWRDPVALYR